MNLDSPQTRYAMLRTSLELFHKPPADLDELQSQQLQKSVNSQLAIGKKLMENAVAGRVVIPDSSVTQAIASLRAEFDDEAGFSKTLAYNGLSEESLYEALRYELTVEATLEQMLSDEAKVSDEEVEIYYLQHKDRFLLPETRTVCHILITINEDYSENSRAQAKKRIEAISKECAGSGMKLKALAQRHSECPSAMREGVIGRVKAGQLYPEIDLVLFAMSEGEVSGVIESEMGFHLLYCETVHAAETLPLEKVKDKVSQLIEQKKRSALLKQKLA